MDYHSYQTHVPIYTYETLWQKYIAPHQYGLDNILTQGKVTHLARTSGSSAGQEKYMPVNHAFLKHMQKSAKIQGLFNYLRCTPTEQQHLLWQPMLWLSDLSDYFTMGSYPTAMISRITREKMRGYPRLVPKTTLFSEVVAAERFHETLIQACTQDLSALSGVTPWLLHFCEQALRHTNTRYLHEIWPKLCFIMHAGVNFSPYQKRFEALLNQPVHFIENYVATEGYLGIQDLASPWLRCLPQHGLFYEFIKQTERLHVQPKRYGLWQIEPSVIYSLIITNPAGFWSVEVGDTVIFERLLPYPRFRVCGRVQDKCDFFGEKLLLSEIQQALTQVCQQSNLILQHFAVGPHRQERRLQWVVETQQSSISHSPEMDTKIEAEIDKHLKQLNSQYARNRRQNIHGPPSIYWVNSGHFQQWLTRQHTTETQTKPPQLFNQAEALYTFIKGV